MNYGSISYGRFTHEEWARREAEGNPFFEEGGHIYRITETHRTPSDVRYQAITVSQDDRERWLARRAQERELKPSPDSSTPEGDESESDAAWTQEMVDEARRQAEALDVQVEVELTPKSEEDGGREESAADLDPASAEVLRESDRAPARDTREEDAPTRIEKPDYKLFARRNGWAGTGRIPGRVREQYEDLYGAPDE